MYMLPLIDCAELLAITPKSLSTWVRDAEMELYDHPTDGRSKCLTMEQIQQLADLHQRGNIRLDVLFQRPLLEMKDVEEPQQESVAEIPMSFSLQEEADLRLKFQQMEMDIATLQMQVTQLTLLLLQEPIEREPQYKQLLETLVKALGEGSQILKERPLHPTEQRARDREIPQILYDGDNDSYTIVCAGEGKITLIPDTPEWFDWLVSLSSFHFVGKNGRYTASRNRLGKNKGMARSWEGQRTFHKKQFRQYMGVTERLTIHHLEAIATSIVAKITSWEGEQNTLPS